ncbi:MAG: hypothetical protein KY460_08575 [Actinobacteria bacterium]|nr:hypothetical protein [Actinomycetota bacterium]
MTIVVTVLTVAVIVLTVLVAGLLRSHAVILRRLHDLGGDVDMDGAPGADAAPTPPPATDDLDLPQPPTVSEGRVAADLSGVGPRGEARAIRVAGTPHDTILVFLSSGCTTCHRFWDDLRAAGGDDDDPRVVVVSRGADAESRTAIADIAPRELTVVMSSEAWTAYEVPGSPYVVHVDGPSGRVRGEGTGPTWQQVQRMLRQGAGDLDARRAGHRTASADAQREEDVDRVLLAAGIEPGDASLYTRADGTTVTRTT